MRWTAAVLWRIIFANPWNIRGSVNARTELGARRLNADLQIWQDKQSIDPSRRIGELTLPMLGDSDFDEQFKVHPGCGLKLKAAETGIIMNFALWFLEIKQPTRVAFFDELVVAGRALARYMEIIRSADVVVSRSHHQELIDCAQRHLLNTGRAEIAYVPKHHMFVHLTVRSRHTATTSIKLSYVYVMLHTYEI